jgi:hypothetical protein
MLLRLTIIATCILYVSIARQAGASQPEVVFESDVQPLLGQKCGKCHREDVRKGGLDLSTMQSVRRGGESGDSLVAASLDDNLLWTLVESGEMPPEDEPRLQEDDLDLIRRWIVGGAKSEAPDHSVSASLNQHSILPIVLLRCTTCHGARRQEGGLDLRTVADMLQGGKRGPAFVAGDADSSLMVQRIENNACPPSEKLLKFFVRRPPTSETETLRGWISAGAPQVESAPDIATTKPDPLVSDEDRQHWAFQPPRTAERSGSIDKFIGQRLADVGLEFSARADRDTLIRRVHIDLVGMPPTIDEYRQLRTSDDPRWYQTMVDRLLASPHYGERWGRYWLDLAGYADSEGGVSDDPLRLVAWKYRDYVIDAFNTDKPYDRYLIEQLAGDELLDYQNATEVTEPMVQNLVATGFLRMGIDETGSRTMNFVPERLKVISDAIHIVSSGLMGLTMECARCHSHKYDPIPHRDYYRFKAIFQGALDEHDWDSFKTRTLKVATPAHRKAVARVNPPLDKQIKQSSAREKKTIAALQLELLRFHYPEQSEQDNRRTLAAWKIADNNRTLPQRRLVERLQQAELLPDTKQPESVINIRQEIRQLNRQIDRLRRHQVSPLAIRALWDLGRPSPTYILRRGEHNKPGDLVGPGVPSVLTDGQTPFLVEPPFHNGTNKTGRRLALAKWLTHPDHPLTSRVMVNRIWYHHFGRGLVKELNNFGVQTEPPSHPELLDWLATEFIRRGWSVKEIHRLILNSRTYQQSSRVTDRQHEIDPENRLVSRMRTRRMDAEALRDSLLMVSGKLEDTPGGIPDTVSVDRDGLVSVNPTDGSGWRRSVYLQYRRTEIPTMMDTFDYPQMGPNCVVRNVSTISPQSLMLKNNAHVRELADGFADRVKRIIGQQVWPEQSPDSHRATIECVYQLALCRAPNDLELQLGTDALQQLASDWGGSPDKALDTYCHTIFNSAAFLYVD